MGVLEHRDEATMKRLMLYDYVELNSDLELSGKNRRLKAEYIMERFMKEQDGKVEVH